MDPAPPATTCSERGAGAEEAAPDKCTFVDLLAASLEEACDTQGDRVYPLLARIIDQHLAGSLQSRPVGRWRDEAMDALLSLISPALQARLATSRSSRASSAHRG